MRVNNQTDASINSLSLEKNQNMEEFKNKLGELTLENMSVASGLDDCNSTIKTNRQVYRSEIRLNSDIENMGSKINCNWANQAASAICTSPQPSTKIRVIDTGQPTRQFSPDVLESGSHISPGVNGVSVYNAPACNSVKNTNTIATSCIQNVSAHSEMSADTSQYNELSLSKCSDISKQVAVPFVRELDEYFTIRKPHERLRLPLVFLSISNPFANRRRGEKSNTSLRFKTCSINM